MKKLIVVVLTAVLAGCAGLATAPQGCESAVAYKIPGFIPMGPAVIRAGVLTALTAKPEIKPAVQTASLTAWKLVQAGNLHGGLAELTVLSKEVSGFALPAVIMLEAATGGFKAGNVAITQCDKDIFLSLIKNIGMDAGVDGVKFQ